MKKRLLSWLMVLTLCLTLLPTAALAEGPEDGADEVQDEQQLPEQPVEETKQEQQPVEESKQEEQEESGDAVQAAQALIDALPDKVTADNADELQAQLMALDEALDALTDEQRAELDMTRYEAVCEVLSNLTAVLAGGTHEHYLCGGTECNGEGHEREEGGMTTFEPWNGSTSGTFYLNSDLDLTSTLTVRSGSSLTLCLNGYGITMKAAGDAIVVEKGATFTLCDCKHGGTVNDYGAIRHTDSLQYNGRGVTVEAGTFYMYGGKISNNTVGYNDNSRGIGGGVVVSNKGIFNMIGGEITGNTAKTGGGVDVGAAHGIYDDDDKLLGGTFSMTGGKIYGNNCVSKGGGVYVNSTATNFTVSGSAQITGNYYTGTYYGGSTQNANNVYLGKYTNTTAGVTTTATITVNGTLTGSIGVNTDDVDHLVATGVVSKADAKRFTSDNSARCLKYSSANQTLTMVEVTVHANHPVCGDANCTDHGDNITDWKGISDLSTINAAGNYYLTKDVEINGTWQAPNGVNLCLNGYGIIETGDVDAIKVNGNTFTLCDCVGTGEITHAEGKTGSGVYVINGTFIMHGGSITGNTVETKGGGVTVEGGTFNMYGGTISGNTSTMNGGGVYVNSSTFTMTGSACIAHNKVTGNSSRGGGVCVWNSANFDMNGGTISDNSGYNGGGVYVGNGTKFTMTNGTITKNTANYGGGVWTSSSFTVSGDVKITGNTQNNVYLSDTKIIIGEKGLNPGAEIGVTNSHEDNINTGEFVTVATGAANSCKADNFSADKDEPYGIKVEPGTDANSVNVNLYNGLPHQHPICGETCTDGTHTGEDDILTWIGVSSLSEITGAGNYYLTQDVETTGWTVPTVSEGVNLCLNGHSITRKYNDTWQGAVITVTYKSQGNLHGKLAVCDCNGSGRGNGQITHEEKAGGVGVRLEYASAFDMYGGRITGNNDYGVNVGGSAAFHMYGGSINNNKGGVYGSGTITVSGDVHITDNNGTNVNLFSGKPIMVSGALGEDAMIGVTTTIPDDSYVTVARGTDTSPLTESDLGRFESDNTSYGKKFVDGSVIIYNGTLHEHAVCGKKNCTDGHGDNEVWLPLTYDAEDNWLHSGGKSLSRSTDGHILPAGNYYLYENITTDRPIMIYGDVNLCLNGHTISTTADLTGRGKALIKNDGHSLTICDCSEQGKGEIKVPSGAMNGILTTGALTMYGGTITGGAEYGVYVTTFNSSSSTGTFRMYGGTITGNQTGVGRYENANTLTFGGDAKVKDNTRINVSLLNTGIITIDTSLTAEAKIGVYFTQKPADTERKQFATGANGELDYAAIFSCDNGSDYVLTKDTNGNLYFGKHQHVWSYTAEGATITATCTDTTCTSKNGGSVTIVAPAADTLTYDGNGKRAILTGTFDSSITMPTIRYKVADQTETFEAPPVNAGSYEASITMGEDPNRATATVTYEIKKATPQASDFTFTATTNLTYDGTPKYPRFTPGIGGVTVYPTYYDAGGNEVSPINVGTYTVRIKVEVQSNDNYNSVNELTDNSWTFTILQADYTGQKSDKTIDIVKGRGTAQTGTLTAADFFPEGTELPADAEIASVTPASGTMMASVTVNDGTLTYTSNTNIAATENESYTVTISTTNYKNFEVTLTFHPADKQPQTNFGFKDVVGGKVTKTYGDDVFKLEATGQVDGSKVTYSSNDDTVAVVDENTGMVAIKGVGTVKITAKALATEEYAEATAEYTLTVSPKTLTANDLEFTTDTITKTYDGDTTCTTATVQIKSAAKVNQNDVLPTVTGTYAYNSKDVNSASKVTFTSTESSSTNYILPANLTVENAANITKRVLTVGKVDTISKTYNTLDNALDCVTGIELIGTVSGETLRFYTSAETGGDYGIYETKFDNANAGQNKTITGTVALLSTPAAANYTFKDAGGNETTTATFTANGEIVKANARDLGTVRLEQRYTDTDEKEYQPDYAALMPANAGKLTYDVSYEVTKGTASVGKNDKEEATGKLTYQISAQAGAEITWTFTVRSDNYEDSTFKLVVTITDRDKQENFQFKNTTITKTYGDPDFTVAATGAEEGSAVTYTSSDPAVATVDADGTVTIKKAGTVTITATAEQTDVYASASASYTLTVNKATVTVKAKDKSAYVGDVAPELPTAPVKDTDYTVTGLIGEDTLSGTVTLAYGNTPDMNKVGEETITISGTLANANYEITYVNGKLSITNRPSSGGGSYTPTYPVSTPSKTENGSVSSNVKNASKGDTVTITVKPDSGYVLDDLTVTDKNGNELKLNDKGNGKYTFTMPAGKVEVKASFAEAVETSPFADVETNAYYYEAVKWAADKGITGGIGNSLFGPNQPCTRAQIVTFLWRAAGSPEPKGTAAGMTDVVSGSYYEKAVAWAIENGVTTGTTASTFSPNATCTRAQAVTFLARALSAKATSAAEFSDVPANSYFAEAVAWAAANSVTEGVGNGLFAPHNNCTRAQIVTFLYRAYNK